MATETEPIGLGKTTEAFRAQVGDWNSSPEQRASTRHAIRVTCAAIVPMLDQAQREGDVGGAAAGCVAYFAEIVPLLVDQVEQLEERIACLEEER